MGGRLNVCWRIDPGAMQAIVPNLMLQPIIENAIRHGIAPQSAGGTIDIIARSENGCLTIVVRDTGAGLRPGPDGVIKQGMGLSNLRRRLGCLYGTEHQFRFNNRPEGGCEVFICLPFKQRASADVDGISQGRAAHGPRPSGHLDRVSERHDSYGAEPVKAET